MHDQRALPVEDDVDRRNRDPSEVARFNVCAQQSCHAKDELLMREERCRRLAHLAEGELALPVGFFSAVQVLLCRHDDDDAIVRLRNQDR